MPIHALLRVLVVAVAGLVLSACGGTAPEVEAGADPALFDGRQIWVNQCASCHGASGGGGRGLQLNDGRVVARYPDPAEQVTLIREGRGGMPSYAGRLTDAEIDAVVRYTREIIAEVE